MNDTFIDGLVALLAWAHHRFLWMHPFLDYNGRIGRLLNNIILLSLDFPPIRLKSGNKSGRKAYIESASKRRIRRNLSRWKKW
ncbi:MAG: Fic family protein [Candidatus Moraniibacteriota bacterium]|nr:MAG: Fic family protein [Candidatus Moranbacteria bacterium]